MDNKITANTLTFQFPRNSGAILQAFALEKYLENNGCEVKIIDYWPPYADKFRWYGAFRKSPSLKSFIQIFSTRKLTMEFDRFKKQYMQMTKQCRSIKDIEKLPLVDIDIVGSDQVWNPYLLGEYNDAYFLNFKTNAIKASYAASSGQDSFTDGELEKFAGYLKGFDFISVREESFREKLEEHGVSNVEDHLDPVFLLDREDYRKIEQCKITGPYILVYYQDPKRMTDNLALRLSKARGGIPVYRFGKQKDKNGVIGITHLSVEEFLGLIDNAEYVVSSSFHACAFSILFRKQFYAISAGDRSSRLLSLLNHFHLSDRFVENEEALKSLEVKDIVYEDHEAYIKEYTEKSKSYLKLVLDEARKRKNEVVKGVK